MWIAYIIGGIGVFVFMMSQSEASTLVKSKNLMPTKWDDLFKRYASENGFDWRLSKTISMNESSLGKNSRVAIGLNNPYDIKGSTSFDGKSWGLMQLIIPTARDFDKSADEIKLNNAEYSIKIASKLIGSLSRQFNGKTRDIVMAYNHGAGNQKRFIEMEKQGILKDNQFQAGRDYYAKFLKNYNLLWG